MYFIVEMFLQIGASRMAFFYLRDSVLLNIIPREINIPKNLEYRFVFYHYFLVYSHYDTHSPNETAET